MMTDRKGENEWKGKAALGKQAPAFFQSPSLGITKRRKGAFFYYMVHDYPLFPLVYLLYLSSCSGLSAARALNVVE
jgi:hypothetical protein